MNSNNKILHGTIDIANQMFTLTKELKRRGYLACSLNYYPNYFSYEKADYILDVNMFADLNEANYFYSHMMKRYIEHFDIFHFHFGTSLTLDNRDLPLLYELNKKIFMHHWGSDVRRYSLSVKYNPYTVVKVSDEVSILKKLEILGKYIKTCFVADYELYLHVKDFYEKVIILPQAINLEKYDFVPIQSKKRDRIKIVHAPTNRMVKGTNFILKAINELTEGYRIELVLVENMSHQQAVEVYKSADIVIDQLCIGTYGLFALEAMALGKPVVAYINEEFSKFYPKDLPIIFANPDNLKQVLKYILDNLEILDELSYKSRKYVEQYHDVKHVVDKLVEYYNL